MGYNLLTNGIYWVYNPFTNHLLTSWDIQVSFPFKRTKIGVYFILWNEKAT